MSKYDIVGQSDGNHKYINWDFVSSLNMNGAGIEANLDEELCSSSFSCALEQLCQSDKVLLPKTWDIVYNKSNKTFSSIFVYFFELNKVRDCVNKQAEV